MRFDRHQYKVLRTSTNGTKLCVRRLNQNPLFFVTYGGVIIHIGTRKHCVRKFNSYSIELIDEVKYLEA